MLLTITNLYPRPDEPQRGLYNAQQFRAMAELLDSRKERLVNLCLVPEWRVWRWPAIRQWKDPFQHRFETRYVPAFYVPVLGRNRMWRSYREAVESQSDWLAACDKILATWLYPDGVAAEEVGRRACKPVWLKIHGTDRFHLDAPGRGPRTAAACRQAAGVVCVSQPLAERVRQAGVPARQVHVVPNGVDAELFRWRPRDEAAAELAQRRPANRALPDRRLVLFVGNLVPIKGPDIMLAAWTMLKASGEAEPRNTDEARECDRRATQLVVIGDGPMRGDLERRATRAGLAEHVAFLGSRPHDEVALWMNAADCLCLTSRSEGLPNVALEALASGLPVVAANVGACAEVLRGEPAARLVPAAAREVAEALRACLAAPVDRQAMAARHARRLSWRASAEALLALMR